MTKSQKLTKDIQRGAVKYLHVSVLVSRDVEGRAMRTPRGHGVTARKVKVAK